ncbi:MAG: sugar phosphate isomerase/epimerase [Chthonomonadaceae bacterium]|nr:sugar phosphate isomerase/epimerase [Chthonomonadaceae bacterium]
MAATGGFRYGLNTSTIQGQKLSLVEEIEIAAQAGYQAIEPWINEIERYVEGGGSLPELKRRLEDHGLTVEGAIGFAEWIVDDDARRAKGFETAKRDMELVAQIGGKRMAAPAMGATEIAGFDLFRIAERYRALLELGEQTGVAPILEVWGFSKTLTRLSEATFVAQETGHANATILADVYHLYKGGSPIEGLALLHPAVLPVLHMNDYPDLPRETIGDADRVYPGDGVAPMQKIFSLLNQIGFDGVLSVELFNRDYWKEDAITVAKTALAKTRAVVENAVRS